jgi:RHH-type proline utilization regulon transcriptional repressor/proline dehydrogenase/delta 1-pyrroline-5-carboxylate dehydrogenase
MRARNLEKMAQLLEEQKNHFFSLLVHEGGKTLDDAVSEVREAIDFCNYYAWQAKLHFGQAQTLPGPTGELNQLNLHPRGVIACISPWNFPLAIFLGQVTAALAAGNCVIAKPASQTVFIAAKATELLHQAGFAKEVVQLLPGSGAVVGDALVTDERIKGIVFTGSTETARSINQKLSQRKSAIIPFIAETGGQNAMIVDSSALAEQVTQDVIASAFRSAGQRCSALRVLFLQEDIADKVLKMLIGAMHELKIGNPVEISTDVGPVIDEAAKSQLFAHAVKMKEKAKLLCELPLDAHCAQGSFFAPRLFEIPSLDMLTEEVFGPILHVIRFNSDNLDDVIAQINRTGFGLTLGIHSRIDETIQHIIANVNVGNIYVNRNMIGAVVGVQPFGGEGLSGTGPKAGGPLYLQRLATERTVSTNTTASGGNASLMSLEA